MGEPGGDVVELKVRDVMTSEVHGISEESSLATAIRAMASKGINSLIVWPVERDEPYGILTSSDLVDAIASGRDLEDTTVAGFRTTPIVLVTPGVRVKDAAQMMTRMNLRHLAVFNGKEIVGIVSNFDLVRAAAKDIRGFLLRERTPLVEAV